MGYEHDGSVIGALTADYQDRIDTLAKYRRYYVGDQEIVFVGEKLQSAFGEALEALSCNRCGPIVDTLSDRMVIEGFTSTSEAASARASEIWDANEMKLGAGEVHRELFTAGDAYAIVWPNIDTGEPELFVNYADRMAIGWNAESPSEISVALKLWRRRDGSWRANLYRRDRLEKYSSISKDINPPRVADQWEPYSDDRDLSWPIPYGDSWSGRVPVFHFANNARQGEYGVSELKSIIPLQDRYNLTLATLAIAEEHQSYRQRWATGIQVVKDDDGKPISPFTAGAGQLWISTSSEANFGDFDAADLAQFEKIAEGWELKIARTARIPVYHLTMSGDAPSGEMLKTSESPLISKIRDRMESAGSTWRELMLYALRGSGIAVNDLEVTWRNPEPRSELDFWGVSQTKRDRGVSDQQILREWGYSDEEIESMLDEIAEKGDAMGELMARAFNRGSSINPGGEEIDDEEGESE